MDNKNYKSGRLTIIISLVSGIFLIAIKILLGIIGRSQALITDAVHSVTDFISDFLALAGLKYRFKKADDDHPFGHGKIDTLMSLLIGVVLIIVGALMAYSAVESLMNGEYSRPNTWALIGVIISLVVKESLFHYTVIIGKRIQSSAIVANAWHHRSDAMSSVAVLVGLIPAILDPALAYFDSIAAIIVALMIGWVGLDIVIPAFRSAADTSPGEEVIREILEVASEVDGVINAHDIRARYYSNQIYAELHIVVDPDITVRESHRIAVKVRRLVNDKVDNILDVIVHVDPNDEQTEYSTKLTDV